MSSDTKTTLRAYIERELARGRAFGDDESLLESGILSSMGILDLLEFMNGTFAIDIDETELEPEHFETLDAMVALVAHKQDGSQARG